MDISAEIAAIQAASQGSELRQPLVGALNKLNSGALPAVTASDAGKILKVGANGWEVGEKSGYMPVPTATKQITENGTHNVTDYASAVVNVSGGGSTNDVALFGDLFHYVAISNKSGDKFYRGDRWFLRNSSEPIIVLPGGYTSGGAAVFSYTGYAIIAFSPTVPTGSSSNYGNLSSAVKKTTPNGVDYWASIMNGCYPPSTRPNMINVQYEGNDYSSLRILVDESKIAIDFSNGNIIGDQTLIYRLNSLIDSIYQNYYIE